jgi:hypothetical protein
VPEAGGFVWRGIAEADAWGAAVASEGVIGAGVSADAAVPIRWAAILARRLSKAAFAGGGKERQICAAERLSNLISLAPKDGILVVDTSMLKNGRGRRARRNGRAICIRVARIRG